MSNLHLAKKNSYWGRSEESSKNSPSWFEMLNELKELKEKDIVWKRKFEDEFIATQIRVSSLETELITLFKKKRFTKKRRGKNNEKM